nr:pyridoxal phosphate-dependent transferase [Tanacetum cinerariifolium]
MDVVCSTKQLARVACYRCIGSIRYGLTRVIFLPDSIIASFYKVLWYEPTGFGCLLIRKSVIGSLQKQSSHSSSGVLTHLVRDVYETELEHGGSTVFDETEIFSVMKSPVATDDESPEDSMWIDLSQSPIGSPKYKKNMKPRIVLGCSDKGYRLVWKVKIIISVTKEYELDRTEPEVMCRHLDHVNMLGLNKTTFRLCFLINWLVTSFLQLRLPGSNTEDVVPLSHIYGPKIKYERGAAVAFNIRDRIKGLMFKGWLKQMEFHLVLLFLAM